MAAQESFGSGGLVSEWRRLQAEQLELRVELEQESDQERRAELVARLKAGRKELASFDAGMNAPATSRPPSLYRFDDLDPIDPLPAGLDGETTDQPVGDEIDDLLRTLTEDSDSSGDETAEAPDGPSPKVADPAPIVRRGTPPLPAGPPRKHLGRSSTAGANGQAPKPSSEGNADPPPADPSPANTAPSGPTVTDGLATEPAPGNSVAVAAIAGAIGALLLIGAGFLIWTIASNRAGAGTGDGGEEAAVASATGGPAAEAEELRSILDVLGLDEVDVALDGSVIHLTGVVESEQEHAVVMRAANALAEDTSLDTTGLIVDPGSAASLDESGEEDVGPALTISESELQAEIDLITAVTPVIFDAQTSQLGELQLRVLAKIAEVLLEHPEARVEVVGFTDASGDPATNSELSLARASNVERFLVSRGVEASRLRVVARGEEGSTGAAVLAGLERRVDFEVVGSR